MKPNIKEELWRAYIELLEAEKNHEVTDEKVTPLLNKIVKKHQFKKEVRTGNGRLLEEGIIEDQKDMYLASDEDAEVYFKEAGELYKKLGYDLPEHVCPVLVAKSNLIAKQIEFIDASLYLVKQTGLSKQNLMSNLKMQKEYIALTKKLMDTITPAFYSEDGYLLKRTKTDEGIVWTDGDLEFDEEHGYPVDSMGQKLSGKIIL